MKKITHEKKPFKDALHMSPDVILTVKSSRKCHNCICHLKTVNLSLYYNY